jgi:phosphoribosylformimino-5-aminoimidazole carboxamide ribotide isomerase
LESTLTRSSQILDVAHALAEAVGSMHLYLADLDAIAGKPPAVQHFRLLAERGFELWVDAGICCAADARPLVDAGVHQVVAGLETLANLEELARLQKVVIPDRVVFSLDLRAGSPLGRSAELLREPLDLVAAARERGVRRMILLDIARVGMGRGIGTESLCREIKGRWPELELFVGGGVRGVDDICCAARAGASGVLVASALHNGRVTPADVRQLSGLISGFQA